MWYELKNLHFTTKSTSDKGYVQLASYESNCLKHGGPSYLNAGYHGTSLNQYHYLPDLGTYQTNLSGSTP